MFENEFDVLHRTDLNGKKSYIKGYMHSLTTLNDENFSFENILNFQTVYQIHEMCYYLALTVGQNVLLPSTDCRTKCVIA